MRQERPVCRLQQGTNDFSMGPELGCGECFDGLSSRPRYSLLLSTVITQHESESMGHGEAAP